MTSAEIRQRFLDFFAARGHQVVAGGPLVPAGDPTLLFTNAGMVQFKDVFLGKEKRERPRAVTSQRCVRAGGKHNDLENVGYTGRHHTFFEMLGNFSFGDYFKREAIAYAWEFLTAELGLPAERLWVTVHESDDEAAAIWLDEIGADPSRFARMGDADNFWAMGDTGPCGPCSEIYYDHGPEAAGGPPGGPDGEGDRYVEIWNLVFMQFERAADGAMTPLPKPSVDTGAGLERIAAVMQGARDNYETDLFAPLVADAAAIAGRADLRDSSLKVIADHIRSCAFMLVDGVAPSPEGRGYVLRRIIRRAARHGHRLGIKGPFLHRLVASLDRVMGDAYPELRERRELVERALKAEEEQFARTLENGMAILDRAIRELKSDTLPGGVVFKLYDTYGFPADLTADIARERGLKVDMEGFEREMAKQRERAREGGDFSARDGLDLDPALRTAFTGYDGLRGGARVVAVFSPDGARLDAAADGEEALVVLDSSPFYGESGGQVGDRGTLKSGGGVRMEVSDTQKQGEALVHRGVARGGGLRTGDRVEAEVEPRSRAAVTLNHSATHLLHSALRGVLGPHVTQKGSLVAADRLRFDFSHPEPVGAQELGRIEDQVNARVFENSPVLKEIMPLAAAREKGALALFGEKYGEEVRVVSMAGDYSVEFCGGCHADRTGDIGLFKICGETGIAAGVRRIEAVTGAAALALTRRREEILDQLGALLKTGADGLVEKARQLAAGHRALEKECERLKAHMASGAGEDLAGRAVKVKGINVLAASVEGFGPKSLREAVDRLKDRLGECVVVLAGVGGDGVSMVAGVSKGLVGRVQAGELVNMVAGQVGGKGGGRPDMAMAGGGDAAAVPDALASVAPWVERKL